MWHLSFNHDNGKTDIYNKIMTILINRRVISDRRQGGDRRKAPRLDLTHKRRRKTDGRRDTARTLIEDFWANQAPLSKHPTGHCHH